MGSTASLQICRPGYDTRDCPDWAYLFNSDWPSLAIAKETTMDLSSPGTFTHNLGFPPLSMGWISNGSVCYGRFPTFAGIAITPTTVTPTTVGTHLNVGKLVIRCFNIDVSAEAEYPVPQSASATLPYDNTFGGKIAKNGRYIYSNNLNDFILHTRGQSPATMNVATEKGKYMFTHLGHEFIKVPLRTSYLPWGMVGINFGAGSKNYNLYGLGFASYAAGSGGSDASLTLGIDATASGSIILMRDPLFYPNTVRVVY